MDTRNDAKSIDEVLNSLNTEEEPVEVPADWAYPKFYQMNVELRDGTIVNGFAQKSAFSNELYVHPDGLDHSYVELATLFGDSGKTQMIQMHMSENETITYTGYTQLGSIMADNTGKYTVTLRRPY